jgi:hypothetical protein
MHVAKNPCIPLVPNFPYDKQRVGGDGFAVWSGVDCHVVPPHLDGEISPLVWKDIGNAQPIPNGVPKAHSEVAMDEKVSNRFRHLLAKWAQATVWPTTPF